LEERQREEAPPKLIGDPAPVDQDGFARTAGALSPARRGRLGMLRRSKLK
jgi:hypothetical protein